MAHLEGSPASAPQEKIPFLAMVAANFVDVSEYLQVRSQLSREYLSGTEYEQISNAAGAIKYDAASDDNHCFDPSDEIKPSRDPRVRWARRYLTNVPLPIYLLARQECLEAEIARSTSNLRELETIEGLEGEAEKAFMRELNLKNDLFLTEKVAAVAKISLT